MNTMLHCPKCKKKYVLHHDKTGASRKYLCKTCNIELQATQQDASQQAKSLPDLPANLKDAPDDVKKAFKSDKTIIAGKYYVVKKIGQGGMGAVYKVWDATLKRYAAIKMVLPSMEDSDLREESLKRFMQEAQTYARLAHPYILQVFETGEDNGRFYICMEYIEGGTLEEYFIRKSKAKTDSGVKGKSFHQKPSQKDMEEYLSLMLKVIEGLEFAHSHNVIHRDIKPENILLQTDDAGHITPKVADFGLAKSITADKKLTVSGVVIGTPLYMSPEQALGKESDRRSDVFSLGSVLYRLCTGIEPFQAKTPIDIMMAVVNKDPIAPSKLNMAINSELEIIILKAMEKEKNRRFISAKELAQDIERFMKGEAIHAKPASLIYKMSKNVKRNKYAFAGIATGALILIVVLAGLWISKTNRFEQALKNKETADELYEKGKYQEAKDIYIRYMEVVNDDGEAGKRMEDCDNKIKEAASAMNLKLAENEKDKRIAEERRVKEAAANQEVQTAWLDVNDIFIEFYKPKTDMKKAWEKTDEAIKMLTKSLDKYPTVMGYFYRGILHKEKSDLEQAEKDFSAAIKLDQSFTIAYVLRGIVYFEKYNEFCSVKGGFTGTEAKKTSNNFISLAEKDFDKMQALSGNAAEAGKIPAQFKKLAKLFEAVKWKEKNIDRCIGELVKGFDEYKAEEFQFWLAIVCSETGNAEQAETFFNQALKIRPQYAEVYYMRGVLREKHGDINGAVKDYTAAIEIKPFYYAPYNNRGAIKLSANDLTGAIDDFNSAILFNPNLPPALLNRGVAKDMRGDLNGAIADYSAVMKLGDFDMAYFNRARSRTQKGDFTGALKDFDKSIEMNPGYAKYHLHRGNLRDSLEDYSGAIDDYNAIIAVDKNNFDAYSNRAGSKAKKGDFNGAVEDCNKAIELNPDDAQIYSNRGGAKLGLNDFEGAIADFDTAIRLDPGGAPAFFNRGVAFYGAGRYEESRADFEKAKKLDPAFARRVDAFMKK
ncbi:MAG: tetratricopeptide repeat protein [Planctomycetes bacterium]|nr:tetratricopeptide repeat protein [Planctomycetota bacterium]